MKNPITNAESTKVLNYDDYLDQAVRTKQISEKEAEACKESTKSYSKKNAYNIMK